MLLARHRLIVSGGGGGGVEVMVGGILVDSGRVMV